MVSIIVPVYNGKDYIAHTVACICNQTYTDYEVILVDDGSTDGSGQICDALADSNACIRVIHQANGGVSAARNAGIDQARGAYICFVDADDVIEPQMLECLVTNAQRYNVDISCCGLVQIGLDGKMSDNTCDGRKEEIQDMDTLLCAFFEDPLYKNVLYGPYNKIIKTQIVRSVRFQSRFTIGEDLLFNFECLERAKGFFLDNRPLYRYVKRENSLTTSAFSEKAFDYSYVGDILYEKCVKEHPYAAVLCEKWLYRNKINLCRDMAMHRSIYRKHIRFFRENLAFCKAHKAAVWQALTVKQRIDYNLLTLCPGIFVPLGKLIGVTKRILRQVGRR